MFQKKSGIEGLEQPNTYRTPELRNVQNVPDRGVVP